MTLTLEQQAAQDRQLIPGVFITPPINEEYWTFRVQVSGDNAIVAFPKFTGFGVGFQHEEDWNTNLPYTCSTEEIYQHIKHNGPGIPKATVLQAIEMVQRAVRTMRGEQVTQEGTDAM